jgi:hypothetical protein
MTTLTLTTRKELRFVIGLHIDHPLREVERELAALAAETRVSGDHVALGFRDPLDALLGWQHLRRAFDPQASLMSVIASPAAMEMLRDPSELAREAFSALTAGITDEAAIADGLFIVATSRRRLLRPMVPEVEASPGGLVLAVVGRDRDRIQELTQPGWVGRAKDAPIRIDDATIAKRHLELGVDSHEGWFARDANSTGGWWLANQRAGAKRHALHTGMVLELALDAALVVLS